MVIKELPEMWPSVMFFSLPYIQLVGTVRFTEEFRGRLAKNYDFIEAVGDAWTLGLSRDFLIRENLKSLLRPRAPELFVQRDSKHLRERPNFQVHTGDQFTKTYLPLLVCHTFRFLQEIAKTQGDV